MVALLNFNITSINQCKHQFRDSNVSDYNLPKDLDPENLFVPRQWYPRGDRSTMVPAQHCSSRWRSRVWTSDAMLVSCWFSGVPIFARSGGVPIFIRPGGVLVEARFRYELTSECRWSVSLVWTVLEQSTELSMPEWCLMVLRCRGTNREFGSVQQVENARLPTDEECWPTVLDVHRRSIEFVLFELRTFLRIGWNVRPNPEFVITLLQDCSEYSRPIQCGFLS